VTKDGGHGGQTNFYFALVSITPHPRASMHFW
jgi:hypothetical protein